MTWAFVPYDPANPTAQTTVRPPKPTTSKKRKVLTQTSARKKRKTGVTIDMVEIAKSSCLPFEPTMAANASVSVINFNGDNTDMAVDFEEEINGVIKFARTDDKLIQLVQVHADRTEKPRTIDGDVLKYFDKMFSPFYEFLLHELNDMREKRIVARCAEKKNK